MTDRLVLSVAEAAEALGVSDDLVYELTERGELPCLRFGRRKLIPRRAVELLVEAAITDFDVDTVPISLKRTADAVGRNGTDDADPALPATRAERTSAQRGAKPLSSHRPEAATSTPPSPARERATPGRRRCTPAVRVTRRRPTRRTAATAR
jgi:excisionase family DNA binding protein